METGTHSYVVQVPCMYHNRQSFFGVGSVADGYSQFLLRRMSQGPITLYSIDYIVVVIPHTLPLTSPISHLPHIQSLIQLDDPSTPE